MAITIESQYDGLRIEIDWFITSESGRLVGKYSIFHQRV